MGILGSIISAGGQSITESVTDTIEKNIENKTEREKLKTDIQKILIEADMELQNHITRRWESDNKAAWYTKAWRPTMGAIIVLSFLGVLMFGSPTELQMHYLYELSSLVCLAYWGGRSAEKAVSIIKGDGIVKNIGSDIIKDMTQSKKKSWFGKLFNKKKKEEVEE